MPLPLNKCNELFDFLDRSGFKVGKARRASRKFADLSRYEELETKLKGFFSCFGDVNIHFYGSRMIGLGSYHSDLDVYIDIGHNFWRGNSRQNIINQLEFLHYVVRNDRSFTVIGIPLLNATVPLLRCYYQPMRGGRMAAVCPKHVRVDFTFSNGLGVMNSKLLQHLFAMQPESIRMLHHIRICLCIIGTRFKGYQLTLLIVFLLQVEKIFPSVDQAQKGVTCKMIDGVNCAFNASPSIQEYGLRPMGHFRIYLRRFCEFYGGFDFQRFVISPRHGNSIKKPQKGQLAIKKCNDLSLPMALENLLRSDYNVTYNIGNKRLFNFIWACLDSSDFLHKLNY